MNYPIWDLPAAGLLIAVVAILHVFVSHFAVGGGLFLVVTEMKARRENDGALLDYLRRHSRFFILLTLVFGAVTGVGIWFTIGLVHPAATSSLINAFVWVWAIEWTFFFIEIAAAIVYYYGWDRLSPKQHLTVGWIYFGSAWASLVVINGILAYMLTPGAWIESRDILAAFFNPTYWPSLVIRTLGAMGLAGVYALFTASWLGWSDIRTAHLAGDESRRTRAIALKRKIARYAAMGWVLPMAVGLPVSLLWYFAMADGAGVPVAEIFGSSSASARDMVASMFATVTTGQPMAQRALRAAFASITLTVLLTFALFYFRRERFGRVGTAVLMVAALLSIGASEWVREDLRKPFVIGSYMFVNGVRMPPPEGSTAAARSEIDPLRIDAIDRAGVLTTAKFVRLPAGGIDGSEWSLTQQAEAGAEVFRLLCSQCHTLDGYVAIRPLVQGRSVAALEGMLGRLAVPRAEAGHEPSWSARGVQLATWRDRRMPPFVGTGQERQALAVYLAQLGGGSSGVVAIDGSHPGHEVFESFCGACHASDGPWPIGERLGSRSEAGFYDLIAVLPDVNPAMPAFDGTDQQRLELASYLASLAAHKPQAGSLLFENSCAMCHAPDGDLALERRVAGRSEADLYEMLGRLPEIDSMMPPFDGSDDERRALARHLGAMAQHGRR
jgi:cytochrome bd-type quinol oxidase subunit 1/mono/diheme cytochrome c family protein